LNDSDGLTVTANALTGIATITGSTGTDTITGSGQADVITGGNGADTIDGGAGIDTITLTETVAAADEVILTSIGATAYANIIGYTAGSDDIQVPDATHALFGDGTADNDGTVAYVEAATIKAAKAADDNFTFGAITTAMADDIIDGFVAGTKTEAELEAAAITAMGATGAMVATDIVVMSIADNEDTALFLFTGGDAATDDAVDAAEIQLLGIVQGLDDVTDFVAGDFLVS
jgi:hypothetical protein